MSPRDPIKCAVRIALVLLLAACSLQGETFLTLSGGTTTTSSLSLGTGDTPQFLRLGLGAAADANHSLFISQGTITSDKHAIDATATWNSAVVMYGIKLNVTDTASDSASLLIDLQKAGVSQFKVTKSGALTTTGQITSGSDFLQNSGSGYFRWSGRSRLSSEGDGVISLDANVSSIAPLYNVTFGPNAGLAVAGPVTLFGAKGLGTDKAGSNLILAGGASTGTGTPGLVQVRTGFVSTTGATTNVLGTAVALGGTLKVSTTTTGNVGADEDTLITYTIPASQLGVNGFYLEFDVWGSFGANANTKRMKVHFGATAIGDTTALIFNGIPWRAHGKVVRKTSTTQTATCETTVGGTLLGATTTTITQTTAPGETLTGTVVFKVTGEDSGGVPVNDSVIQEGMVLKTYPGN